MMVMVESANGRIHFAEETTQVQSSRRTAKEYDGYVRKLCDGQWIANKHQRSNVEVTCNICKKNRED